MKAQLTKAILTVLLMGSLAGCYRMPGDDEFSVVPTTNNPDITREQLRESAMPNVSY